VHPPLTDAVVGAYTVAAALGVIGAAGWIDRAAGQSMWLALVVGLALGGPTALTGLADWTRITPGTPLRRTATAHMLAMVVATVLFALAAVFQYRGYDEGAVTASGLVLALVGYAALTVGGWLGGTVVYVHGMRVLGRPREPASTAVVPGRHEREAA
jgi:uncharacterized membrane protein